jgi:hypothetical protein
VKCGRLTYDPTKFAQWCSCEATDAEVAKPLLEEVGRFPGLLGKNALVKDDAN